MGTMGTTLEGAAAALGRQQWLDKAAGPLQQAIGKAFAAGGEAGRRFNNVLHGTWLGHPLHPVLTDIPVGSWTAAAVLDALDMAGGRVRSGADTAVEIGLGGAVAAALSGMADWQHVDGHARRIGLVHALLNVGAVTLYTASVISRHTGKRTAGRATAFAGFSLALVSSYLGGHMVYADLVGVDHAMEQAPPSDFVRVMAADDLPEDQPRKVEAKGVPVVLVRHDGRIYALAEICAHLGGPLSEGSLEGASIICPWHGSRYALDDGRVLDGPSAFPQPCLEVRVVDGQIEVRSRTPELVPA